MDSTRRFLDDFYARVWGTDDPTAIDRAVDELVSRDCKVVGLPDTTDIARSGFKQFRHAFREAFGQATVVVEEIVESDDRFAFRGTFTVSKDGKSYSVTGGGICRVRNGQVVEAYNQWDFLGLLEQIGTVKKDSLITTLRGLASTR